MKFGAYAGASLAVALITIAHAWSTRVQYYPTVVYLTTNKLAQVAIGNLGLMLTLAMGRLVRTIFLGQLRDIEVEVMYENARFAITETCLALTVFRSDITVGTLAFFTILLFVKSFHWLSQARVEHLEQSGAQSITAMARLASLGFLNLVVDVSMVDYCLGQITFDRPSVLILFAFEFAILSITAAATAVKFALHIVDSNMAGAWHGKTMWNMLLEFFSEVFRFSFYMVFFMVMFTIYSVPPLHLIRDIYMSFAQIQRRLRAFYRYRQLAANMDQRFPDATEEELAECEHTCIICRDVMDAGKKLPCAHIFHFQCLRLWLQQQQACPTCRANIPTEGSAAAAAAAAERARAAAAVAPAAAADPVADRQQPQPPAPPPAPATYPPRVPGVEAAAQTGQHGFPSAVEGIGGRDSGDVATAPVAVGGGGGGDGDGDGRAHIAAAVSGLATGGGFGVPSGGDGFGGDGMYGGDVGGFVGAGLLLGAGAEATVAEGGGAVGGAGGGVAPPGMPIHVVIVAAEEGTTVRKNADPDSPVLRREAKDAVLLLLEPQAPCGSFRVFGGWAGGPGRETHVRLVDITKPEPQSPLSNGLPNASGMPDVAPSVDNSTPAGGSESPVDDTQGPSPTASSGVAEEKIGHEDGLRRRAGGVDVRDDES